MVRFIKKKIVLFYKLFIKKKIVLFYKLFIKKIFKVRNNNQENSKKYISRKKKLKLWYNKPEKIFNFKSRRHKWN